jgi:hypothetical protein
VVAEVGETGSKCIRNAKFHMKMLTFKKLKKVKYMDRLEPQGSEN